MHKTAFSCNAEYYNHIQTLKRDILKALYIKIQIHTSKYKKKCYLYKAVA